MTESKALCKIMDVEDQRGVSAAPRRTRITLTLRFRNSPFSQDKAIDPGDAVPGGTTSKNPLIVVAPDPQQQPANSKKNFRFGSFVH